MVVLSSLGHLTSPTLWFYVVQVCLEDPNPSAAFTSQVLGFISSTIHYSHNNLKKLLKCVCTCACVHVRVCSQFSDVSWVLETEFRSSGFRGKHLTHGAILPQEFLPPPWLAFHSTVLSWCIFFFSHVTMSSKKAGRLCPGICHEHLQTLFCIDDPTQFRQAGRFSGFQGHIPLSYVFTVSSCFC